MCNFLFKYRVCLLFLLLGVGSCLEAADLTRDKLQEAFGFEVKVDYKADVDSDSQTQVGLLGSGGVFTLRKGSNPNGGAEKGSAEGIINEFLEVKLGAVYEKFANQIAKQNIHIVENVGRLDDYGAKISFVSFCIIVMDSPFLMPRTNDLYMWESGEDYYLLNVSIPLGEVLSREELQQAVIAIYERTIQQQSTNDEQN